jgi:hypothetical protein
VGELQLACREVDRVGEHLQPERCTRLFHVEAEPVGHHRDFGAVRPKVVGQGHESGVERDLGGDGAQGTFVALDQRPLVVHALAAADLAALVLLVEGPPPVGAGPLEQVDPDVAGADGAVEVEEHRGARKVEREARHAVQGIEAPARSRIRNIRGPCVKHSADTFMTCPDGRRGCQRRACGATPLDSLSSPRCC